ncbi:50S ribosomal protein L18 [Candidatus Roizmanbacteria bacterium CG_4_10_14_3_um_filter_39_13]|uniref:Large ribosomal subunit protein uL18 n=4 Tax=Candidatus Roizmaniibacteriota TaxID=1752723 RepID=A0A2H0KKT3_9BACT|nr:MAG: 50S ribosomal protein L18 [Candidatus Roizmanbacteria bacterium CG11_big_fil_rev_8_21_14_0_20_37_16]PIV08852.1 MAG: 50S ribosomal protein L18 [Candidatus Roizmanbacteria bacterium CG03_land_8_20_14_0_80_39_12]PIV70688.1 MAG: 50S ribosomal protein L18 [Candidatus Roizmanbacteria bacterium CG17_big_fil_post_rev_8_21_14_2_50_39_7]PIX69005.1 MAG: 50S ribosomal protein L18 [Candidatus Roizmanbacteria bacterium CG_4_10_14_3_um_filter_39_13]
MKKHITTDRKIRRKKRVSMNIIGSAEKPRISVYRSTKNVYAQAIDDTTETTVCAVHSKTVPNGKKADESFEVGKKLGTLLKEKNITKAVFDRGPYTYLGRVKRLAEGLREAGIQV